MKPNFLIVGAAKCGTTSLFEYLSQHPAIYMPRWKEPSFFVGDPFKPLNRAEKTIYFKLFDKVNHESAIGEASTAYLIDEAAPKLIKKNLGRIKIIIILRDPVAMSYSLYKQQVHREGETAKSFEAALAAEQSRRQNPEFRRKCYGWHANYYYYNRGLYYQQVKRYLDTFGKDHVKIFIFDELADNPVRVVQETYRFLGVDDTFIPVIKIHNPAGGILNIPKFWVDTGLFLKTVQFVFSKNLIKKIPHLLRNIGRKPPRSINPLTRKKLRENYYDDIQRLERLIGKDLSAWKK